MKKAVIVIAMVSTLALAGCGSSGTASSSAAAEPSGSAAAASEQGAEATFDGSAFSDTGDVTIMLKSSAGTTENGNIPQIAAKGPNGGMTLGIDYKGGDGTLCTIYVDGVENSKMNAGERGTGSIVIQGDAIAEGVHTVEVVAMDGDKPAIYKKMQYEIVY